MIIVTVVTITLVVVSAILILICCYKRLLHKHKYGELAKEDDIKASIETTTYPVKYSREWDLQNIDYSPKRRIIYDYCGKRLEPENGDYSCHRYSYSDIEEMTNGFGEKLGAGRFGIVYKGKLLHNSTTLVAVKILNNPPDNANYPDTRFIREVLRISWASHVNVVRLVGYCCEGTVRALVYEFMPNGSLSDFIRDRAASVGWDQLVGIAMGLAQGMAYLHLFLGARCVHLGIEQHSILLDKDLHPKITDFGLARLCNPYDYKEVVIGKSDLYTYGITIFDMVRRKKGKEKNSSDNNERDDSDELTLTGSMGDQQGLWSRLVTSIALWRVEKKQKKSDDFDKEMKEYCDVMVGMYGENENTVDRVENKVEYESVKKMIIVGLKCMKLYHKGARWAVNILAASTTDDIELPPILSLYDPASQQCRGS